MKRANWLDLLCTVAGIRKPLPPKARVVYNAKINSHRGQADPIDPGAQSEDLTAF